MSENNTSQWYLRTDTTSVFGPVSIEMLIQWAQQARILPGHEVSRDRNSWIRAESLAELAMDTYIDLGDDRQSGPFNRVAAEALLASGKVPAGARIISADDDEGEFETSSEPENDSTGTDSTTFQNQPADAEERNETSENGNALEGDAVDAFETEAQQDIDSISVSDESAKIAAEMSAKIDELQMALENARAENIALGEKLSRQSAQLSAESEKLSAMIGKYENAEELAEEKGRELSAIAAKLAGCESSLDEANSRISEKERQYSELKQQNDELQSDLATVRSERDSALDEAKRLNEAKLAVETEVEQLRHRLADTEAAVADRDLKLDASQALIANIKADAEKKAAEFSETEAELRKNCNLSPEAVRKFHEDRQMLYNAAKDSAEKIAQTLEEEFSLLEQLKQLSAHRQHLMLDNRRTMLRIHDSAPSDVIKFSVSGRESEAQILHLRAQLDNVTLTSQREKAFAETRENELVRRIRTLESELAHARENLIKEEAKASRVQLAESTLAEREKELQSERHDRAEEKQRFEINQATLLSRIETLEKRLFASGSPN